MTESGVLLPAVRAAVHDTLIIADGFSCREQIQQMTDRRPLHVAQVLQMATKKRPLIPAEDFRGTTHFDGNAMAMR